MFVQLAQVAEYCHWYVYVGAGLPVHDPGVVVTVVPTLTLAVLSFGAAAFAGGAAMESVAAEYAVLEPAAFVAVTATRRTRPATLGPAT